MRRLSQVLIALLLVLLVVPAMRAGAQPDTSTAAAEGRTYDLVIVGGTPGGLMAAIAAARMGRSSVILERTAHIGGLPANGLGATDIYTRGATGGLFMEFVNRVYRHYVETYGKDSPQARTSSQGYHFEPHVAEMVFEEMLAEHPRITVLRMRQFNAHPDHVVKSENGRIQRILVLNRKTGKTESYAGRIFVDATYEGDLAAAAGVPYRVGREGREAYDEPFAGKVYKYWDGPAGPRSTYQGDNAIQAYNYRLCLTTVDSIRVPIPKPDPYHREEYVSLIGDVWTGRHTGEEMLELTEEQIAENKRRLANGKQAIVPGEPQGMQRIVNKVKLPNGKTDANNQHLAFISTDLPEENWPWPTSSWAWRDSFAVRLENYTLGLLWFAQHDEALPESFREKTRQWGLCATEYEDNDHFPRQVYVREGRRIIGMYNFTAHDALPVEEGSRPPIHSTSVTASHYAIDSHGVRKREPGRVHLDGFLSYDTKPYTVPYGVIVPQKVPNLLSPVPVSGTHLGFSTLRMEPCWMALGQAAGVAASLSIEAGKPVQDVPIAALQQELSEQDAVLIYYRDAAPSHPYHEALQFFGVRGFIPGWEAHLSEPVAEEVARQWAHWANTAMPETYEPGTTTRGELLNALYEAVQNQPADALKAIRAPAAQ